MTQEQKTESEIVIIPFSETACVINPVHFDHRRAKNWASILRGKNSIVLQMQFLPREGEVIDVEEVKAGDAIEFGGDYYSNGGNKTPTREIYVVQKIEKDGLHCILYPSRAEAMKNRFTKEEEE